MPTHKKIKTPEELSGILEGQKALGRKTVLCHGVFDLWHAGHLHQFEQAKEIGDILVVSLTTDRYVLKGPGRPVFNQNIRASIIAALELTDYVVLCDTQDCVELIKLLKPDFYIKGASCRERAEDPSTRVFLEKKAVEEVGGKLCFTHEIPIHATPLLNHYINPYPEDVLVFLDDFKKRYSFKEIINFLEQLKKLKVMVIGEAIVDQYDFVKPMGVSPKGGVIALKYLNTEMYAGGSLACVGHIANFCSSVTLVTAIGSRNSHKRLILDSMATDNTKPLIMTRDGLSTIIKRREIEMAYFRKYSETYTFDEAPLTPSEEDSFMALLKDGGIKDADLVFVIDYGHGLMTQRVIEFVCNNAPFLSVNTQVNSGNRGLNDVAKYPKADLVCLDRFEASLALRDQWSTVPNQAVKLMASLGASIVAITQGHKGSVISNNKEIFEIPIFSKKVIDTVGAGDAYYSLVAPCVRAGLPLELCGFIGNAAGAIATTYLGNKTTVNSKMLLGFVDTLLG
ncbi:MAG: adenylyltransferase/cytidyltransferase family protein [Candidatus Yanofskybacteria bacterium]|nr:adenylyltransferase/cytidyltransferase family protein [Candidatus Yanofskybacteria bacterium]